MDITNVKVGTDRCEVRNGHVCYGDICSGGTLNLNGFRASRNPDSSWTIQALPGTTGLRRRLPAWWWTRLRSATATRMRGIYHAESHQAQPRQRPLSRICHYLNYGDNLRLTDGLLLHAVSVGTVPVLPLTSTGRHSVAQGRTSRMLLTALTSRSRTTPQDSQVHQRTSKLAASSTALAAHLGGWEVPEEHLQLTTVPHHLVLQLADELGRRYIRRLPAPDLLPSLLGRIDN